MKKTIEELSEQDLKQKIDNIKAERERTANALKRYEEELERRKQEVPLGVPQDGKFFVHADYCVGERFGLFSSDYTKYNCFSSKESAQKHAEMLLDWRKALVANSKGEPIDITVLLPLMKKGWVAYEKEYGWIWFKNKPLILRGTEEDATWVNEGSYSIIGGFNIKPADDWTKSLQECGL